MKLSILLALSILTVSCATRAPLTYKQKCGVKDMVLIGVTEDSGDTTSYSNSLGSTSGSYRGESIQCKVPTTAVQKCEIEAYKQSMGPIEEYNKLHTGRQVFNGVAYAAFILPGALLKWAFDTQRDDAVKKATEIESTKLATCSQAKVEERTPATQSEE